MTTQPTRLHWSSDRYVPKFDRMWTPAGSSPDLRDWFIHERERSFPRLRQFVAPSAASLTEDPTDWMNRVTYVRAEGRIPAELIYNARELYPEFQKQVLWALYEKAGKDNVALLTKPRFWLYWERAIFGTFECVAASLAGPMIDLEAAL